MIAQTAVTTRFACNRVPSHAISPTRPTTITRKKKKAGAKTVAFLS